MKTNGFCKKIIPASTPNIISGGITEEAVQPLGAGGNTGGTLGDDWGNARWGNTGGTLGEQSVVLDAGIPACTLGEYWGNTGRTCTLGNTGGTGIHNCSRRLHLKPSARFRV